MKQDGIVGQLGPFHMNIIQDGKEYFQEIKEESLSTARQRWEVSNITVRNREPFGYRNFKVASSHFHKYSNMVLTMGPEWIGRRYRTPIKWYPPEKYRRDYTLKDQDVNQDFAILKKKNGFRNYEEVYPTYSLTQLHLN